jgi:FdhD protein
MLTPAVANSVIKKFNSGNITDAVDLLATEEPLEIRLGFGRAHDRKQHSISITMRTPGNDFELALGFLFTEGIIHRQDDVLRITYCTDVNLQENKNNIVRVELKEDIAVDLNKLIRNFYTTSSCGICGKASIEAVRTTIPIYQPVSGKAVSAALILELPRKLREKQQVFEYTGGLHAAALFDASGEIIFIREDVGRHNALDKLIGAALAKKTLPLSQQLLLLSGRASFELIQKAAIAGIHLVCAVGAPSSLAVATAKEFDITLVGFLREQHFNIYAVPERILLT